MRHIFIVQHQVALLMKEVNIQKELARSSTAAVNTRIQLSHLSQVRHIANKSSVVNTLASSQSVTRTSCLQVRERVT